MNAFKSLLLTTAISLTGIAACNYTVGECYPRDEVPGSATEGVGAGGGILVPGGFGGAYGDSPGIEPQSATNPELKCNSDESETERVTEGTTCDADGSMNNGATFAICSGACQKPCAGVNGYSPSLFNFVTIIPDDGIGEAGGWQTASLVFKVKRWTNLLPEAWECPQMTFGAPLRNKAQGKISSEFAASVAAGLATQVSHTLKDVEEHGIYCVQLKESLKTSFPKLIVGAKVTQP